MTDVFVPASGIVLDDVVLLEWRKAPGDHVEVDDVIAVVETDKVTMDVTSPAAGTLTDVMFEVGDNVPLGTTIARVVPDEEAT